MKDDLRTRLTQSVETALALAEGLVVVDLVETAESDDVLAELRLPRARRVAARAAAAHLLVQLAARRVPALHRARRPAGDRPRPARPRPVALDRRRRARAVGGRQLGLLRVGDPGDRRPVRDPDRRPVAGPDGRAAEPVPRRHRRRQGLRAVPQPDGTAALVHGRLRGHRLVAPAALPRDGFSSTQRERIEEYMSFRPCPVCKGARLKPEVLAVTVGGKNIHEFTQLSVTRCARVPRRARADPDRAADRRARSSRRSASGSRSSTTSASATSSSTARLRRSPAARRSGCGSRRRSARSSSACSTSSTSRRSACTSATTTG